MEPLKLHDLYELHRMAAAESVGLSPHAFCEALTAVGERYLDAGATYAQRISFYQKLRLQDFALAQACAIGNPTAWAQFLERFDGRLFATALALSRNEQIAKDLADSLAGDLFANGGLGSKFCSYSGRGSLEGWLQALVSNKHIDRCRAQRREVSLEQHIHILKGLWILEGEKQNGNDPRLDAAIEAAFSECPPEERFLLAAYFFDGWTMAKIASAVGIHESSASRRIDRILGKLRGSINRRLQRAGMSPGQIEESLKHEGLELSIDVRGILLRGLVRE
jgi:RNA polymerase sigma factor (sigma-70 family)